MVGAGGCWLHGRRPSAKTLKLDHLEEVKVVNKVSVGEPAEGSLPKLGELDPKGRGILRTLTSVFGTRPWMGTLQLQSFLLARVQFSNLFGDVELPVRR